MRVRWIILVNTSVRSSQSDRDVTHDHFAITDDGGEWGVLTLSFIHNDNRLPTSYDHNLFARYDALSSSGMRVRWAGCIGTIALVNRSRGCGISSLSTIIVESGGGWWLE